MKCPYCRAHTTQVANSRSTRFQAQIWRRRRCTACGRTFTTYEVADLSFLTVTPYPTTKPQAYSRAKLFSSVYRSFESLFPSDLDIDALATTVETKLLDNKQSGITSATVARAVLETLQNYAPAAALRYLSAHADLLPEYIAAPTKRHRRRS